MIPKKGKRYLLSYHFDNHYTDIGTYTGETWREEDGLEYKFKVTGGTLLVREEDIKQCIDNPRDGSTLDNFRLHEELDAALTLAEIATKERDKLAEFATKERERLIEGIKEVLYDNRHLADGENCALIKLKRLISFEFPKE